MRVAAPNRSTLRAVALLAVGALAACGSPRTVGGGAVDCQGCHGGASGNAAPPRSVSGETATTATKVGAHQAHLGAQRLRGPIACEECHVVPADMAAHLAEIDRIQAGTAQRVTFGTLAGAGTWDPTTGKCGNVYCHGATMNHGGSNVTPSWTTVDGSQASCGTCHFQRADILAGGSFPAGHPSGNDHCYACHPDTVLADDVTVNAASGKHINGLIDGGCNTCHAAPPTDAGHQRHAALTAVYGDTRITSAFAGADATSYAFGCGNCHPLDFAAHSVHTVSSPSLVPIVSLDPAGAPGGSLRSKNDATAAWDPIGKTCSGVYCHSSGQESPAFVTSPPWDATPGTLGCAGCHANPPNYANGGAGAATANSHVGRFPATGDVAGHFAGLPAELHQGSAHGGGTGTQFSGDSASPITCQTCHYLTADPSNTGPSGFYYLDTSGSYDVAGQPASAFCAGCHDGTPATGSGKVMPYYHVNGARDVAFDPRTTLSIPGTLTLPASPNTPTRPYWYTRATTNNISGTASPAVAGVSGRSDAGFDGTTLSLHVKDATWDPSTKSCGNVACHLNRASATWGEPLSSTSGTGTCNVCHSQ